MHVPKRHVGIYRKKPIDLCRSVRIIVIGRLGACHNSFLVFVSDCSRSGLAKKSVQILDSLDVLP